jgi:uncharacterized protein
MPQSLLLTALQNPELYDHPVIEFKVLETHISWILLTGNYAYKIKKPVDLGFLDFSSLEKRHHYCLEELRLNSRLAPEIYLEVVYITGTGQTPAINKNGPIIDYAVKMRQFPQENLLINLLNAGKLTARHIDRLATAIANFHDKIATAPKNTVFGTPPAVLQPVTENFLQIQQQIDSSYQQELEQLQNWSTKEHQHRTAIFHKRKTAGFIRECHGDLHLGNIVIYKGKITPFDGIEFNENLYWIDVISELAFLVMDLDGHRRTDLAFRTLNAYLEKTGDYAGLAVLRYYLVYRAMVRAKVNCIRSQQQFTAPEPSPQLSEFLNYLQLAQSYTNPAMPRLIICYGLSGSGKTTVSQLLLEAIPGIRIRSDVERKRLHGLKPEQKSKSPFHCGLYTAQASWQTYQRLYELAQLIIDAGYTAIVDATFLKHEQRKLFQSLAQQCNIPLLIVQCTAPTEVLRQRIISREKLGHDASEANLKILEQQLENQETLTSEELQYSMSIDTGTTIDIEPLLQWL